MAIHLEPDEIETAIKVANKIARKWVRIDADDLQQHLMVWLCMHINYVERWREEEGNGKLYVSLRREASKYCSKETSEVIHRDIDYDDYAYSKDVIVRSLPYLWEMDTLREGQLDIGGDALAILTDINAAYWGLPEDERNILAWRFRDGDTYRKLGKYLNLTEDASRKRVDRAIIRLQRSIGSEKISWTKPTKKETPVIDGP